jgi:hypothetical protein
VRDGGELPRCGEPGTTTSGEPGAPQLVDQFLSTEPWELAVKVEMCVQVQPSAPDNAGQEVIDGNRDGHSTGLTLTVP